MAFESDKIMFEIYKDTQYNKNYRVVFYTELNEHNKHAEISRAMAGEHFFDGFIKDYKKDEAKKIIETIVTELNDGKDITSSIIKDRLKEYTP
jgi:hypothetical protein